VVRREVRFKVLSCRWLQLAGEFPNYTKIGLVIWDFRSSEAGERKKNFLFGGFSNVSMVKESSLVNKVSQVLYAIQSLCFIVRKVGTLGREVLKLFCIVLRCCNLRGLFVLCADKIK
jgi:hypothetical protein